VKLAKEWVSMEGLELASKVSRPEAQTVHSEGPYKIVAIDYGIKQSTINKFTERGCTLRIFPAEGNYIDEIKSWNPNGFLFSSGPGDPNATKEYAFKIINFAKQTDKPVFGIGMGHQLLALSEGVSVKKMFVGHRGINQPVKNLTTGLVEITSQNHGFNVDEETLNNNKAEVTHRNLNDNSIEGLRFKNFPGISVQYQPEASPGPHDSIYLFDNFLEMIDDKKKMKEVTAK